MQEPGRIIHSTPAHDATSTSSTMVAHAADSAATRPVDLVRWGPILAGIFAALSTLATLTVLGIAVGASTYTPGAALSDLGIGAGIWAGISTLIAFFVGGLVAARTAAVGGHSNGILNGAMVWFVAIPLLLYVLGHGVGSLLGAAGNLVGGAAQSVAGPAATQVAANPTAAATAVAAGVQGAQATVQTLATAVNVTPQAVAGSTANSAWGVLLSLGLAAAASILGGYLGARSHPLASLTVRQTTTRT